ncbi:MAG: hypothetical protein IPO40_11660 [Fibrobacteres bacterium]|nr:hypothetical protein [Fibrobacterota bacterium]
MPKQVLDIRKVVLVGLPGEPPLAGTEPEFVPPVEDTEVVVIPPPPPPPDTTGHLLSAYSVSELDSARVNARYGIQAAANPASQVSVVVYNGFVRLQAPRIASEPGYKGYSAYVGLIHPIVPDWRVVDVSKLTSLDFEFRNTNKITGKLLVAFGSEAYTRTQQYAGTIYESDVSGAAKMSPGIQWKSVSLDVMDFYPPLWWTAPAEFPMFDSVLRVAHSIQFVPQSLYTGEGVEGNKACYKCVGPDMKEQTLDIRNIRLVGVTLPATSRTLERRGDGGLAVSFADGVLSMTGIDGLGEVVVRDLKGRPVASFMASTRTPLQLGRGTYILTAKRGGMPLTRSFTVMGR